MLESLNGYKTFIGFAVAFLGYLLKLSGVEAAAADAIIAAGLSLAGVGVAHKLDKLRDSLSEAMLVRLTKVDEQPADWGPLDIQDAERIVERYNDSVRDLSHPGREPGPTPFAQTDITGSPDLTPRAPEGSPHFTG